MAVIFSVPSQLYTPRTINASPNVAAGAQSLVVTLTRELWPVGAVGSITINFPNGTLAAAVTFDGGVQTDKAGNVIQRTGVRINAPEGSSLPGGNYGVVVEILQALTTAVTVERF